MRSSGTTFVCAIKQVLQPIQDFTKSFVDDMIVHSNDWKSHLESIDRYLTVMKSGGFSLSMIGTKKQVVKFFASVPLTNN